MRALHLEGELTAISVFKHSTSIMFCSVVPNLIEMLGTLLGRAGGGLGGGGGAGGAVATTWMKEIMFSVSAVEFLALVFIFFDTFCRMISYNRKQRQK